MLFHDGRVKRECERCGKLYRPRTADQRFCGRWCRMKTKAAEGRAARRAWWQQGRPMPADEVGDERVHRAHVERERREATG